MNTTDEYPPATLATARQMGYTKFTGKRKCNECGTEYRRFKYKHEYLCVSCYPMLMVEPNAITTSTQVKMAEKRHNQRVKKSMRNNITIPVVFRGHNIVKG